MLEGLGREQLVHMLRLMMRIRHFEDRVFELLGRNVLTGASHVYAGSEAVAVGACSAVTGKDYITSTHRGHGHCIARGGDLKLMMAELCGKKTGYCRGRGGSMHIADVAAGNLGATGVVGGHIPVATGAAVACKIKGESRIVLCFFGDGASNNGSFHESLNLAGAWKLPVVYVCENNMYGMSVPWAKAAAIKDVAKRAEAYGFEGIVVDGQLPLEVRRAVLAAAEKARGGGGPTLVEAKTYRYRGHSRSDARKYRTKEEEEYWRGRCPILLFRKLLDEKGIFSQAESDRLNEEVVREVDEAEKFAMESPYPDRTELFEDVYANWIEGEKGLVRKS